MGAGQGYYTVEEEAEKEGKRPAGGRKKSNPKPAALFSVGEERDGEPRTETEGTDGHGGEGGAREDVVAVSSREQLITRHVEEVHMEMRYSRSVSGPSGHQQVTSSMHAHRSMSMQAEMRGEGEASDIIMAISRRYSFSVRSKILTGPPPSMQRGRRRSSSFLEFVGKKLGGNFLHEPEDMVDMGGGGGGGEGEECGSCRLSCVAQKTLRRVFQDIVNPEEIVDYHVHLVGHGDSGSGCHLHHSTKTWKYPVRRIKTAVFMAASQTPDMEGGDIQYISRLIRLAKHFVPAAVFDKTKYVPNEYAIQMAVDFPNLFIPFGSVNPYRPDALEELEKCAQCGVKVIKWLPNSMGIDPSDQRCVPFYHKMKELDMALLVHVGEEHSVDAAYINNKLGNPLLLRTPLDCGVKVIGAHCATEGYATDFERGGGSVSCFSLFLRLMREDRYKDLLFGDISAVCAFKRLPYLKQLLQATDVHDRLVYGSDYPVPAINLVVHTSKLLRQGFISQEENFVLNELYNYNPLLFDYACKRLITGPLGEKFPPSVFRAHPKLPPFRYDSKLLGTPV